MPNLFSSLAAASAKRTPTPEEAANAIVWGVIWIAIAAVVAAAIAWIVWWMFKRLNATDDAPPFQAGFTLASLRDLHRNGELTDEEYNRAKAQLIAGIKAGSGDGADEQ